MRGILNRRVLYTLLSLSIIGLGTLAAIQYAKGTYRITQTGITRGTGLLSANSFPPGAEVLIDGQLATATDDTIYLEPGEYNVEIRKDGYSPWAKRLSVQRELVTQTNAQLFPIASTLTPFTFSGVSRLFPSPDGQKMIYYTSTATSTKSGLYVLELGNNPLSLQRGPRQISDDPENFNLETAQIIWSPDSSEALLVTENSEILLNLDRKNQLSLLPVLGPQATEFLQEWENEMYLRERQYLREFPVEMIQIATSSAKNVYFSPDKKKLLYTATASATLAEGLTPPLPATSTQPEERTLIPGNIYVYDREEDKNFKVGTETQIIAGKVDQDQNNPSTSPLPSPSPSAVPPRIGANRRATTSALLAADDLALTASGSAQLYKQLLAHDLHNSRGVSLSASPSAFLSLQRETPQETANAFNLYHTALYADTFQWFPDSNRLMYISRNQIQIKEYDDTNNTVVYAGPYVGTFVYPWPDGSKLLILTNFGSDIPNNLYGIELK